MGYFVGTIASLYMLVFCSVLEGFPLSSADGKDEKYSGGDEKMKR